MTRRPSFVASTLMGRLLPSLRSRLEVQSSLLAALQGKTDRLHVDQPSSLAELDGQRRGQHRLRRSLVYRGEVTPARRSGELYPGVFYVDPANAEAIERLLSLPATAAIPVFWVLFPIHRESSIAARPERRRSPVRAVCPGHPVPVIPAS